MIVVKYSQKPFSKIILYKHQNQQELENDQASKPRQVHDWS